MKNSVVRTPDRGVTDERVPGLPVSRLPYVAPEIRTLKTETPQSCEQVERQILTLLSLPQAERKEYAHSIAAEARLRISQSTTSETASVSSRSGVYPVTKRVLDILVSALALLALLPVFILIAMAVCLADGGPALYYQPRMGRDGCVFRFYKFRSMCREADSLKATLHPHNEATGGIFKMRNDPRVTPVGRVLRRYSLDELPQLISVLRGDMSLIGPRPMVVDEASSCDARQWQRHKVSPGLLCLREVCGRSGLSFDEWVELDLMYASCDSLAIDLKILSCAIPSVLRSEHAY